MQIKKFSIILIFLVIVTLAEIPASGFAQDDDTEDCSGLVLVGGWARAALSLDNTGNSAAYVVIVNMGEEDETLNLVSTELTATTELHTMSMTEDDVMEMRPIEDGIVIPSGDYAVLQPGAEHVMMIGLTQDLMPEQTLGLTFSFELAGDVELDVPIHIDTPENDDSTLVITDDVSGCAELGFYGAYAQMNIDSSQLEVYGILLNLGEDDQTLLDLASPIAEITELVADDMMIGYDGELIVPAQSYVLLDRNTVNIHLSGLSELMGVPEVTIGDTFELSLTFDNQIEDLVTEIEIIPEESMSMDDMSDGDMDDMQTDDEDDPLDGM